MLLMLLNFRHNVCKEMLFRLNSIKCVDWRQKQRHRDVIVHPIGRLLSRLEIGGRAAPHRSDRSKLLDRTPLADLVGVGTMSSSLRGNGSNDSNLILICYY